MRKPSFYQPSIAPTANFPYGQFQDTTPPINGTAGTIGTKIESAHLTDPFYAILSVMHNAGIEPDNMLENIATGQFFYALNKLFNIEWSIESAKRGGYKVGARVLQNGIEYINQKQGNTSEPATQTELLGTNQTTKEVVGNGWQAVRDYNTGQTLQNWLMPDTNETLPYKIFAENKTTELLKVVPAPKIESFLYEPKNVEEIAALGYFPLLLNTDGTAKEFTDTNNALSNMQKKILERYKNAGYIGIITDTNNNNNTYKLKIESGATLEHIKAGFGLVGFEAGAIGTTTGGGISEHTHFSGTYINANFHEDKIVSWFLELAATEVFEGSRVTSANTYFHKKPITEIGTDPLTKTTLSVGFTNATNIQNNAVKTSSYTTDKTAFIGAPVEKYGDNGGTLNYNETPNKPAGLKVCYGLPISSHYI